MSVRAPLIVKNSQEKVEVVRRYTRVRIKRVSRFVADSIFAFFLFYPTTAIVPRFQNSKKSFVYSCCYRIGFFPVAAVKDIKVSRSMKISSKLVLFSATIRE